MRISKIAFVGLSFFLISTLCYSALKPVHADSGSTVMLGPNSGSQKFGSANCRQKVPCADSGQYISASELASLGNACMLDGFGVSNENGFFDDILGLDVNNCLSVRSDMNKKKDSKMILPLCCLTTLPDNSCVFHCDLYNNWH